MFRCRRSGRTAKSRAGRPNPGNAWIGARPLLQPAARYFLFRASLTEPPELQTQTERPEESQSIRDAETRGGGERGGRRARPRRGRPGVRRGVFQAQGKAI